LLAHELSTEGFSMSQSSLGTWCPGTPDGGDGTDPVGQQNADGHQDGGQLQTSDQQGPHGLIAD